MALDAAPVAADTADRDRPLHIARDFDDLTRGRVTGSEITALCGWYGRTLDRATIAARSAADDVCPACRKLSSAKRGGQ